MADEEKSSAPIGIGAPPLGKPARQSAGGEELGKDDAASRIYEVGYLLVPTISEEELPREVTALKDVLEKEGVSIIAEEFPKLRTLAYPMQKRVGGGYETHASAYFGWVKFEAKSESAAKIEAECKRNGKVLRFILIKTVREQTLSTGRPPRIPRLPAQAGKEAPKDAPASAPVSEVELDKSIEKLIAE